MTTTPQSPCSQQREHFLFVLHICRGSPAPLCVTQGPDRRRSYLANSAGRYAVGRSALQGWVTATKPLGPKRHKLVLPTDRWLKSVTWLHPPRRGQEQPCEASRVPAENTTRSKFPAKEAAHFTTRIPARKDLTQGWGVKRRECTGAFKGTVRGDAV